MNKKNRNEKWACFIQFSNFQLTFLLIHEITHIKNEIQG